MNGSHILLLGGVRSGKSSAAEKAASRYGRHILYVATAEAKDAEMASRIETHRAGRPTTWKTLEAPCDVSPAVLNALENGTTDAVILDCVTMLVSNVLLRDASEESLDRVDEAAAQSRVDEELDGLLDAVRRSGIPWILVSNEVGSGVVPPSALGRIYRDLLGRANQRLAASASAVYLMVAGCLVNLSALGTTDLFER